MTGTSTAHEDIRKLRERPIPSMAPLIEKKRGYRQVMMTGTSASPDREACVDARDSGLAGHNHYANRYNPPYHESIPGAVETLYLRKAVITALHGVDARLHPCGLGLYLLDAWRPDAVQRHFHDHWFPRWLRAHRPDIRPAALTEEVERYWSAPSADGSPAPHATGAAVDLTLYDTSGGQTLFMGGLFDDLTENAHTDWLETAEHVLSMSTSEARSNRRILYWAMTEAGFANNPTEWWHYSLGDQMWAKLRDQPGAHYGRWRPGAS